MSRHWDTAVAVAAAIAAATEGTFSLDVSTVRAAGYPDYELADISTLRVDVVPVGPAPSRRESRNSCERDYPVNVVVQQRCSAGDTDKLRSLLGLLEELQDFLEFNAVAGYGKPAEGSEADHDPELLHIDGRFLGGVRLEYRVTKEP